MISSGGRTTRGMWSIAPILLSYIWVRFSSHVAWSFCASSSWGLRARIFPKSSSAPEKSFSATSSRPAAAPWPSSSTEGDRKGSLRPPCGRSPSGSVAAWRVGGARDAPPAAGPPAEPCVHGSAPARCAGIRARAGWKAPACTPLPRRARPPSCGPCGSGRAPPARGRRTSPWAARRSRFAPAGRDQSALHRAAQRAEHALEPIEASGEPGRLLLLDLQPGDAERRFRPLHRLVAEPVRRGLLEARPQLGELLEQLLRPRLLLLELGSFLLPERPLFVGLGGGLDLLLGEARAGGDGDALAQPGLHVERRDGDDAVRADVEDDVDVHLAALGLAQPRHHELAQQLVLAGDLALPLQHGDFRRGLVVLHRGEDVVGAGRHGGVVRDDAREAAARDGDAQRVGRP